MAELPTVEGHLEVTEGLEDGDLVVTAGVSKITDGLQVRVPDFESPGS